MATDSDCTTPNPTLANTQTVKRWETTTTTIQTKAKAHNIAGVPLKFHACCFFRERPQASGSNHPKLMVFFKPPLLPWHLMLQTSPAILINSENNAISCSCASYHPTSCCWDLSQLLDLSPPAHHVDFWLMGREKGNWTVELLLLWQWLGGCVIQMLFWILEWIFL